MDFQVPSLINFYLGLADVERGQRSIPTAFLSIPRKITCPSHSSRTLDTLQSLDKPPEKPGICGAGAQVEKRDFSMAELKEFWQQLGTLSHEQGILHVSKIGLKNCTIRKGQWNPDKPFSSHEFYGSYDQLWIWKSTPPWPTCE